VPKTILCVDDSKTIRVLVKKTLEPLGYAILEGENGLQGVSLAQEHKPDLIIMDVNMPEMDGLEAVRKIKEDANCSKIPVVFLTTESNPEKKEKGKSLGVSGWMIKPFEDEQLIKIVKMLVP